MPNLQFPLKKSRKTAKLFLGNPSLSSQTTSAETERSSISHDPTPTFSSSSAVAGLAHFGGKLKEKEEEGKWKGGGGSPPPLLQGLWKPPPERGEKGEGEGAYRR